MHCLYRLAVLLILFALLLCGCGEVTEPSLPLVEYKDPAGQYLWAIPEGWQATLDGNTLTLTDPSVADSPESLQIKLFFQPVQADSPEEESAQFKTALEPFLAANIDDTYEIYNEGETKVDRLPAVVLDFAKPHGSTYLVGREVIVVSPSITLAFIGKGERAAWKPSCPLSAKALPDSRWLALPRPIICHELNPIPTCPRFSVYAHHSSAHGGLFDRHQPPAAHRY